MKINFSITVPTEADISAAQFLESMTKSDRNMLEDIAKKLSASEKAFLIKVFQKWESIRAIKT